MVDTTTLHTQANQLGSEGGLDKSWYLIYTKPKQEKLAQVNLERQGFTTYLPKVLLIRRRLGKRVKSIEPMFPRYIFIALDTVNDNWAPIRSTFGVSRMVRFGEDPARVPVGLISLLQQREDESGVQSLTIDEFLAGQKVRLGDGPLMGYEGIFLAQTSQDRVTILLDIIGQERRVSVDPAKLKPVL